MTNRFDDLEQKHAAVKSAEDVVSRARAELDEKNISLTEAQQEMQEMLGISKHPTFQIFKWLNHKTDALTKRKIKSVVVLTGMLAMTALAFIISVGPLFLVAGLIGILGMGYARYLWDGE